MTASGIIGYVLPMAIHADWIVPLSKIFMIASYVPILYALGIILMGTHKS